MDWAALIAQIAGGAAGQAASQMDKDTAMALIKSVTDEYGKIDVPQLQQLVLQQQKGTGLAGIKDDPTYRGQQNAADAQLNDVVNSGGLTLADKTALNAIRAKTSRSESAGRHAIESGMAARGSLDSGAQLAMELQGNQQAAETENAAGASTAAQAQQRAYAAIQQRAANAGAGLDRSYNQKANAARAQDAINAGNAAIANTAAKYNAGIPQQNFNNSMALAGAKAQPAYALAGAHAANAKDTQQYAQGVGNTVAAGFNKAGSSGAGQGAAGNYSGSDQNLPNANTVDNSFANANNGGFNAYPGSSSDALSGSSTRPARVKTVIGEDDDGNPIYGYPRA